MTDSEIADLCRCIYQKHQRALDLIFEHRPDRQAEVHTVLLNLVRARGDLILDVSQKQKVRFGHVDWEALPKGERWTRTGRLILFQFDINAESLELGLWVGPGPAEVRQRLIELATAHQPPFQVPTPKATQNRGWDKIFSRRFLRQEDYENTTRAEIEARIREGWNQFIDQELAALVVPIQAAASSFELPLPNS